jgi:hypothetical protein
MILNRGLVCCLEVAETINPKTIVTVQLANRLIGGGAGGMRDLSCRVSDLDFFLKVEIESETRQCRELLFDLNREMRDDTSMTYKHREGKGID